MSRITAKSTAALLNNQNLFDIAKSALTVKKDLPSIIEFAHHPSFLGRTPLYPRQQTLLKLINLETENMTDYDLEVIDQWTKNFDKQGIAIGISPDVWERVEYLKANGYKHFKEVVNITGRRGGKGHIGGIQGAYLNWQLIQSDDPQEYYGIDKSKDIFIFCVATNIQQAKQFQFADLANTIIDAPCFQPYISTAKEYIVTLRTPSDVRRIAAFEARGIRPQREIASIRNMAVTSNSKSSRGATAYSVMFDEFAHMLIGTDGPRTSDEVYNAITPALDQFGKDGFIYIPTSPFTKVGKCFQLYESGLMTDADTGKPAFPDMLVAQLPSWGPYEDWDDPRFHHFNFKGAPQLYDDTMKRLERRDPDTFKVERMSQWAEVIDAYLNPKMVDRMFEPFVDSSGTLRHLEEQDYGKMAFIYRGHCDPSKSNANTAAIICHMEKIADPEDGEEWFHVIVDWIKVWNPEDYPENQIDYEEIEEELVQVLSRFPTVKTFSYDQYGGFVTLPRMKKRLQELRPPHKAIIKEETFSGQSNTKRAERFKSALGMGWVHSYADTYGSDGGSLLSEELKFLQEKNGRIVKQSMGPVQTKDLADCLMVCVDQLLEDNFMRLELRDKLAGTQLGYGARGGYHTGRVPGNQLSARQKLNMNGAIRKANEYGGMKHRLKGR